MKLLYLDTETTGISHRSTIIQIAAIIEIDGVVKETVNLHCAPFPDSDISEEALAVTKLTREGIFAFDPPVAVCEMFTNTLGKYVNKYDKNDKFTVVGHNIKFDLDMVRNWAFRCGEKFIASYLDFKSDFDTLSYVKCLKVFNRLPATKNNKLTTLCEAFGISLENAHDALGDIEATRSLYYFLKEK